MSKDNRSNASGVDGAEAVHETPAPEPKRRVHNGSTSLCSDCPPVGYITDKTRCLPCPFRMVEAYNALAKPVAP